ncbi:MAG: AAA family ATPase, partial [Planctomycetes bacterium]|nr:AAA family ATPase [Planctomycetota bacterium]
EFVARIILATHPSNEFAPSVTRQYVRYGSSPRGGQSIIRAAKVKALVDGRYNVSASDIRKVAKPALRHRILLNFEGEAEGIRSDAIVDAVLAAIPDVPDTIKKL